MFMMGTFNFLLSRTQKLLPNEVIYKQIFMYNLLVVAGIVSFILLMFLYFKDSTKFNKFYSKDSKIKYSSFTIPAIIIVTYLSLNIISLTKGGGIATTIFGLSTFVTIMLNVFFMNYKVNFKIISGVLVIFALTAFVISESIKINKK
tara:strand:- start:1838 stop:2278 length:441 start_codon:yes stop_codon:yes gene_type:complete